MQLTFYKYQGTGNDFVLIDNRRDIFDKNDTKTVAKLCDRRFGIGADGLILLENHESADFNMVYYNSDGNPSSMCGNGGRCLVAFAHFLNVIGTPAVFMAIDGEHKAKINGDGTVSLKMLDVNQVEQHPQHVFLDTGSPHHVELVSNLEEKDIKMDGAKIRYGELYNEAGSNVNFVMKNSESNFSVRTYERGVEDETLSCGTGVTAVAIAMNYIGGTTLNEITLETQGGPLIVHFDKNEGAYRNVWLVGPAEQVFKGEIEL